MAEGDALKPIDAPPRRVALDGLNALDALGGGRVSLEAARPNVVLLHFFATWCEPCRAELAGLDRLGARLAGNGLVILAVDVGEVDMRVARFFADNPVAFPVLLDRERGTARAWQVDMLPTTFVLDRAARPRLVARGELDWASPDVEAQVRALLAEPPRLTDATRPPDTNEPPGG